MYLFCPDKKNKRGVKNFSLKGCNHVSLSDKAPIGYYIWLHFYRGKKRHTTGPFSSYGLGFDMLCRAGLFLGLRWGGSMNGMDSYYTSIPLLLQLSYWGIKGIRTINFKRKGLGKVIQDLKKKLTKDYNPKNRK